MGVLAPLVLAAASCGYGLWILRLLQYRQRSGGETLALSFGLGMGAIGWLLFPVGVIGQLNLPVLLLVLGVGLAGLFTAWPGLEPGARRPWSTLSVLLVVGLGVSLGIDLLEALAPPADVDTLAYHFALPRRFWEEGRVTFVPIAVEGAVPLLTHMTYVMALGLGGERGLTVWALVTQIGLLALFYVVARRYIAVEWALALTLVLLTTPAMVYGGGSGHVEARTGLFMLIAAVALVDSVRERHLGAAAVAGLAAGFFMGSKYYGLFAATALALVLAWQRRPVTPVLVFGSCVLLAGCQWYLWNLFHTGDPMFPALWAHVNGVPGMWNEEIDRYFDGFYARFWTAVPATPGWFLLYPFAATILPEPAFEAGRTGFGPMLLLALPFALAAVAGRRLVPVELHRFAAAAILFYALWFFIPTGQLLRQLLPIYPLLLLWAGVAATLWSERRRSRAPWAGALAVTLLIGGGVHLLFSVNYVRHHFTGETRQAFLHRNVSFASVADWLNANLGEGDRVGNPLRSLNYLLDVDYLYVAPAYQAQVEIHPQARSVDHLAEQLQRQRLSHLVIYPALSGPEAPSFGINYLGRRLLERGCAELAASIPTRDITSRTMGTGEAMIIDVLAIRLDGPMCRGAEDPAIPGASAGSY